MNIFKCKACGATLNVNENDKIVTCDYCGTTQTIFLSNDEKILKMIARGNELRNSGDFDKAYNIFESAIVEKSDDSELYWNLVLCRYGITYVNDYDEKKKPTINRLSNVSILDDDDYKKILEITKDEEIKNQYIEEATEISKIQSKILDIVNKEKPFDIFISYKESDEYGERTEDSVLATDIYNELTKEGYRVFLSRITLANVIGNEYEPYIYGALYSSKIMILVGTNVDYINSTWVKNEWSRYLNLIKKDSSKKIIPCYKGLDPYDLPKELRNIQAIDISKLGYLQDLILGLNKILGKNKKEEQLNKNATDLLKESINSRLDNCFKFLDLRDFTRAAAIANRIIDEDPENGKAYLALLLCDVKMNFNDLSTYPVDLTNSNYYSKAISFCSQEIKDKLEKINSNAEDDIRRQKNNFLAEFNKSKYHSDYELTELKSKYYDSYRMKDKVQFILDTINSAKNEVSNFVRVPIGYKGRFYFDFKRDLLVFDNGNGDKIEVCPSSLSKITASLKSFYKAVRNHARGQNEGIFDHGDLTIKVTSKSGNSRSIFFKIAKYKDKQFYYKQSNCDLIVDPINEQLSCIKDCCFVKIETEETSNEGFVIKEQNKKDYKKVWLVILFCFVFVVAFFLIIAACAM